MSKTIERKVIAALREAVSIHEGWVMAARVWTLPGNRLSRPIPTPSTYLRALPAADRRIARLLTDEVTAALPEAEHKVRHGHPVWFLDGNPIVGCSKLKDSVRLLFWSGQTFTTPGLAVEGSFKAAEVHYTDVAQVKVMPLRRWLREARAIQSDYKKIVKRKGKLERLK